jgi:hypothetical protein
VCINYPFVATNAKRQLPGSRVHNAAVVPDALFSLSGGDADLPRSSDTKPGLPGRDVDHSASVILFSIHSVSISNTCSPSRYLTMAASSSVTMLGHENAPPVDSGGALIVMVTWPSSLVTGGYSLFSVIADWAAARSTIALSAA